MMGDLDETFQPLSKGFVKDYTDLLVCACEYVSSDQAEKMNGRLLEIGRLLNGMIERSSAFVIGDDRMREDPSIDEFF